MEIQIDSAGLSQIYAADQAVTLARQVNQVVDAVATRPAIAWQAFAPLQMNTVGWTDQYYCFATTTPLVMGAVITMNARYASPMQIGSVYQFADGQFIVHQQSGNSYVVSNAMPLGSYALGLAQAATINNVPTLAPLCAVPVLFNEAVYFNPSDLIAIFLSSSSSGGSVIPPPANALNVVVKPGATATTIGFNDQTNLFYSIS